MNKFKKKKPIPQVRQLPAGLIPGDYSIELFGIRETRQVFALSNGNTIPFKNIIPQLKARIFEQMLNDDNAMSDLAGMDNERALEEFAFCMFGGMDHAADFNPDGSVGTAENFMCGENCRCLAWKSKRIVINGQRLTARQIEVTKLLGTDLPDKAIANELNITESTLDGHKRNLYSIADVQSKTGFILKAITENVIQ